MTKTAVSPTAVRIRTSANGVIQGSTACETGFADTTARPDSIGELSRQWIFEENYFRTQELYVLDSSES